MKVVFVSNLFPDAAGPYRGLDNSCLLQYLSRYCELRVISPRPTLPRLLGKQESPRVACPADARFEPQYPTTYYVPKVGSPFNHLLFAWAIRRPLENLRRRFPFDAILCSWMYPDGCAVARVAATKGEPFVVIAQGSDLHIYLQMAFRRQLICATANASAGVITRCRSLANLLGEAGVPKEKLHTIYNGVDLNTFCLGDRKAARLELGLPPDATVILFVGNFFEIKNPLLLVSAHAELCRCRTGMSVHLVMIGDGPLREPARRKAAASGVAAQVSFVGRIPPTKVARYMQAADLLCLPSDNEGAPNVILEAFACGLRVVATNVGGISEVLCHDFLGRLVEKRNLVELVAALTATLAEPAQPERISRHARQFSWEQTAEAYWKVLKP